MAEIQGTLYICNWCKKRKFVPGKKILKDGWRDKTGQFNLCPDCCARYDGLILRRFKEMAYKTQDALQNDSEPS